MGTTGMSPVLRIPQATEKGYAECPVGGVFDLAYPNSKTRRARVIGGGYIAQAITCSPELYYYEGTEERVDL